VKPCSRPRPQTWPNMISSWVSVSYRKIFSTGMRKMKRMKETCVILRYVDSFKRVFYDKERGMPMTHVIWSPLNG